MCHLQFLVVVQRGTSLARDIHVVRAFLAGCHPAKDSDQFYAICEDVAFVC